MPPRLACLVLVLACAAPAAADDTPQYQGKTAREWMQELTDPALPTRLQALTSLGELGPAAREAVPALLQMLKDRGNAQTNPNTLSPAGLVAAQSLARIGRAAVPTLVQALGSDHPRVRAGVAHALGLMRLPLPAAVAPLQNALKDRDEHVRYQAALALLRLGQKADTVAPILHDLLRALTPAIRLETALLLQQLGPDAKSATALVEALRDEHLELPAPADGGQQDPGMPVPRPRNVAVGALAALGADAVPVLIKAAGDTDPQVRTGALLALSSIQPLVKEARDALQASLKDRDSGVRLLAAVNLWRVTRESGPVLAVLREALSDPDPDQAAVAALALGQIGAPARDVIPTLIDHLKDPRRNLIARHALGLFGAEAVPALVRLLGDEELSAQAVSLLQGSIRDALPAVLKALEAERASVRAAAAEVLSIPGPHAARVLTALRHAARDSDAGVRFQALAALAVLDLTGPENVAAGLGEFLEQKNGPHRRQALIALAAMGRRASKATAALESTLSDPDAAIRWSAARQLYLLSPDNRKALDILLESVKDDVKNGRGIAPIPFKAAAVPRLVDLFKEGPDRLRLIVLNFLVGLGAEGEAAAPALARALEDGSPVVAGQAALVLGRLGPKAKEYVPALEKACQRSAAGKTTAVLIALGRMGPEGLAALHRLAAKSPVRQSAIQALGPLGDHSKTTIDLLTAALKDESQYLQHDAARSLIALGRAELAVPVMREWLRDADIEWRRQTVLELSNPATETPALVPLLIESIKDRDAHVVYQPWPRSSLPLGLMGQYGAGGAIGGGVGFGGGLNFGFGGVSPSSVRSVAIASLGRVGPAAKDAVPALLGLLASEDAGSRTMAAEALGDIGPRARTAIAVLRKAIKDDDADVRLAAAGALARLDRQAAETVTILIASLKEQSPEGFDLSMERKLTCLGRLAVPPLIALVRERGKVGPPDDGRGLFSSRDGYFRAAEAARLLGMIGPDAEDAVAVLLEAIQDREGIRIDPLTQSEPFGPAGFSLRQASAFALGRIGSPAKRAVPKLLAIARDLREDSGLRLMALESVMLLDPQPAVAAPLAKELLHGHLLVGAALAPRFNFVSQLGEAGKDLVPLLAGILDRPGAAVYRAEVVTLLGMLPEAKQALPQLREALKDPVTRVEAARALARIEAQTLIAASAGDLYNPPFAARAAADGIARARFVELPGDAGHRSASGVSAASTVAVAEAVAAFLR